jgi:hypothetical protein
MFGPKMGTYCTNSKDKRFNCSWRRVGLCCEGIPEFIRDWVKVRTKELGLKDFPDDLEVSFVKD